MKYKNRIIVIAIAIVLTLITCIPIFAVREPVEDIFNMTPADLGELQPYDYGYNINDNVIRKAYIRINVNAENGTYGLFGYYNNTVPYVFIITIDNSNITIQRPNESQYTNGFIIYPTYTLSKQGDYYYIPIYILNMSVYFLNNVSDTLALYSSTETNYNTIINEYYNLGYNTGYENGFDEGLYEGQNIQQYTNLTGYVTQLLTQFVGNDAAQYITPIALVLVILFVYFLFIRFLLSLIKAKGVIKTCDIIMIVACIILLVVMYAPMLNLTIKTEQVTSETTETTQVRRTEYIYDEYGRIISGPGGTLVYDEVESTTSEQEQTEVEVTTQPLEKEITTYEETKENIVRS